MDLGSIIYKVLGHKFDDGCRYVQLLTVLETLTQNINNVGVDFFCFKYHISLHLVGVRFGTHYAKR